MQTLIRTNSQDARFIKMIKQLDAYLAIQNGEQDQFYSQYNKIDLLKHALVLEIDGQPAACGAIKEIEPGVMEIKRMFTSPSLRGKGLATIVLTELETWAKELGYKKCVLETGRFMPDAVGLYRKTGYVEIQNYGQYIGVDNSICFEKKL